MKSALDEYKSGTDLYICKLAAIWKIPASTLLRCIKNGDSDFSHKSGKNTIPTSSQELELVSLVEMLSRRGFPHSLKDISTLAYQFTTESNIPGFSDKAEVAGHKWFCGFMHRHKDLGVRKP